MSEDFSTYLDAKYGLDSRSLNRDVIENLQSCLEKQKELNWLDLGTGNGAAIRRLLTPERAASTRITAVDIDSTLLAQARVKLETELTRKAFEIITTPKGLKANRIGSSVEIEFECASILRWKPRDPESRFHLITAQAIMDIVPLQPVVKTIHALLDSGGLFYASLNYDGDTTLIPGYSDGELETEILRYYDRTMEMRRLETQPTGGAYSGRRLINLLGQSGFSLRAYGTSDWNLCPVNGIYRDRDAECLDALITMIYDEARRNPGFSTRSLDHWYSARQMEISRSRLGMIVHQLDVLGERLNTPTS